MKVNKIIACTVMAIMVLAMFVSCVTNRNFVAMPEWPMLPMCLRT